MPPLAKLTLKREMLRGTQCPDGIKDENDENQIDPYIFDPKDLTDFIRRNQIMATESGSIGKKPRVKAKEIKFVGNYFQNIRF